MHVQMEDRLPRARPDVHEHAVVIEPRPARRLGHEPEQPLRLLAREGADVPERVEVALRQYEQVRVGPRIDVADGDEAVSFRDVVALPGETAEEAIVRQRRAPSLSLRRGIQRVEREC